MNSGWRHHVVLDANLFAIGHLEPFRARWTISTNKFPRALKFVPEFVIRISLVSDNLYVYSWIVLPKTHIQTNKHFNFWFLLLNVLLFYLLIPLCTFLSPLLRKKYSDVNKKKIKFKSCEEKSAEKSESTKENSRFGYFTRRTIRRILPHNYPYLTCIMEGFLITMFVRVIERGHSPTGDDLIKYQYNMLCPKFG